MLCDCLLFVSLLVARCVLRVVCWLLIGGFFFYFSCSVACVCCVVSLVCQELLVACCLLCVVRCALAVVHCPLFVCCCMCACCLLCVVSFVARCVVLRCVV